MKFIAATLSYLILAVLFCAAIISLMHGKPTLLIATGLLYTLWFSKTGCLTH
jgi:hypothetical protein